MSEQLKGEVGLRDKVGCGCGGVWSGAEWLSTESRDEVTGKVSCACGVTITFRCVSK